ncbi:MAG: hypothetical protein HC906_07100 [Bacteroidales bacterium]|nr:hypothetical protein [Bacteroidales bacterium]
MPFINWLNIFNFSTEEKINLASNLQVKQIMKEYVNKFLAFAKPINATEFISLKNVLISMLLSLGELLKLNWQQKKSESFENLNVVQKSVSLVFQSKKYIRLKM